MPYGPAYDPAHPDSTPRGLIGYFINGSLTNQFEFLQGQWDLTDDVREVGHRARRLERGQRRLQHQRRGRVPGRERSVEQLVHARGARREGHEQHARHRAFRD